MSKAVKESFPERYWQVFVIGFGLVLTAFFALYSPVVPGVPHTTQTEPQVMTSQPQGVERAPVK